MIRGLPETLLIEYTSEKEVVEKLEEFFAQKLRK
jgi:hypothetical protein